MYIIHMVCEFDIFRDILLCLLNQFLPATYALQMSAFTSQIGIGVPQYLFGDSRWRLLLVLVFPAPPSVVEVIIWL